jgi:hypothetical protein
MTKPLTSPQALEAHRLPDGQLEWVRAIIWGYTELFETLSVHERILYPAIWNYLARYHAPATTRNFPHISTDQELIREHINSLHDLKLLWFDDDLRGVLQCPPFSVLHSPHQVKAFGWERIYACSFVDIPITLMIYGPNVWLQVQSICPRTGETLAYRVKMREDYTLQVDAPPEAKDWCIWLPLNPHPPGDAHLYFHRQRSKINAFLTADDLAIHRQYYPNDPPGAVYSFEQSLYLSGMLLATYANVLVPSV